MAGSEFDARRAWFEELLALPHLWPWQVAQVQALAEELGVTVTIWDRRVDWNYQINAWRPRTDRTRLDGSEVSDATVD